MALTTPDEIEAYLLDGTEKNYHIDRQKAGHGRDKWMADETSREPKIVAFRADSRVLESQVRQLAKKTENIDWSSHALDRMDERGIVFDDALRVLREGFADGTPEKTKYGEWKIKMVRAIKGARQAGVVVIILCEDRLFVKTVEWEDR